MGLASTLSSAMSPLSSFRSCKHVDSCLTVFLCFSLPRRLLKSELGSFISDYFQVSSGAPAPILLAIAIPTRVSFNAYSYTCCSGCRRCWASLLAVVSGLLHSVSGFWVSGLIYIVKNRYSFGFCLSLPYEELCFRNFAVCLSHRRIHSQFVLINSQKNTEPLLQEKKKEFPEQKEVRSVLLVLCLCKHLQGLLGRRQFFLLSASFLWVVYCMSRSLRTAALFSPGTQEGTDRIGLLLLKT